MSKVEEPKGQRTHCWLVSKPALNSPLGPVAAMGGTGKWCHVCAVLRCAVLRHAHYSCPSMSIMPAGQVPHKAAADCFQAWCRAVQCKAYLTKEYYSQGEATPGELRK